MDARLLCFCLAASSALLWPRLPAWPWALLPLAMLLALLTMTGRWRGGVAALCLGLLWMQGSLLLRLGWLDDLPAGHAVTIEGTLLRQERAEPDFTRLLLRLDRLGTQQRWPAPLIQISAYRPLPAWPTGSHLILSVALKPAHGLANQAGWDGRRSLLGKGILATGSLRAVMAVTPAPSHWRDRWLGAAERAWQGLATAPLLRALVFGEQGGISREQWDLLRGAGLTHVIAISGQHIAIVAVIGWWLGGLFGLRAASLVACLLAVLYSALSGFAIATERALIMVLLWSLLRQLWRDWPGWRIWLWAFAALVLWDPWALWSAGFWLSFLAVALLLVAGLMWGRPNLWRIQWLMMLGLLPLQLMLFEGVAPLALLLNLLLLPLFALIIIPCGLVAGLLAPFWSGGAGLLFWLADALLGHVMQLLAWLDAGARLWWPLPAEGALLCIPLLLAFTAWRLPGGRWLLLPSVGLMGLALWPSPERVEISVLDVGQGLSVVISKGERAMIFDTGDRYPGGYNMADAVVLPRVRQRGVRVVDTLIVSHKDRDHAGNRAALLAALPVRRELSSHPFGPLTHPCVAGQAWRWSGVEVAVLWPPQGGWHGPSARNNNSCVLRLAGAGWSLLLPGDIEAPAERELVRRHGAGLASTVLVSAHHGSRTSSTPAFVAAVSPDLVIHSAGFQNRWRFPRPEVVTRFEAAGARQWVTCVAGEVRLTAGDKGLDIRVEREHGPWYRRGGAWWKPALWLE
ncbi:DNA internalization-related competence protein ComEC/Rec2 [Aeromonas simiae]|uniref:DNA internalization-related competence protein ComEC/Rec2 n=1 Tax=Aeromonas simiae TaxID=218936 RepID=UPI00266D44E5|nr:DNA internalization-related competence protein ComEC/Rec2 [Aeromonas simiae]MDO2951514.1 DNA internalization-related competence protein ComEC/Rec2 [Aeromonas simiae]